MIIPAPWTGKQEEMYVKLEKQQGLQHVTHAPVQQQAANVQDSQVQSKIAQEVLQKARSKTFTDTRTSQKLAANSSGTLHSNNNQAPANFNKPLPPVPPRRAVSPPPENNAQLPPVPARKKQPPLELLDLQPYQRRQLHPQIERQLVLQLAAQLPKTPEEH